MLTEIVPSSSPDNVQFSLGRHADPPVSSTKLLIGPPNNIALAYNFVSEISIDRHYSFPDTCPKTKVFARASRFSWTWSQKGMLDIKST